MLFLEKTGFFLARKPVDRWSKIARVVLLVALEDKHLTQITNLELCVEGGSWGKEEIFTSRRLPYDFSNW